MKTAFISDIHGNLEAFESVCASLDAEGVDRVLFLGDIVGYGASPNECIDLLCAVAGQAGVAGNHDWAAIGLHDGEDFNPIAKTAIDWTRERLTEKNRQIILALPLKIALRDMICAHATPESPELWNYVFNLLDASAVFGSQPHRLCFIAHSHCPIIFTEREDGSIEYKRTSSLKLSPGCRYIINSGSVGQPRDGDPRACYGIFDDLLEEYRLVRIEYDIPAAQNKIIRAGLPDFLARRIAIGL